jgi:chorismate mutase
MANLNDEQLNEIRKKIDILDNQILELIEDRFELVEKVAQIKKKKNLPIRDLAREEEILDSKIQKTDLPEKFVKNFYRLLIDTAIKMEKEKIK